MKGMKHGHLHIGTASILLIFLTLCLVSFAALSFVNAKADYRLSLKLAERTRSYYEAVAEAEMFLKETADRDGEFEKKIPLGENEIQFLYVRVSASSGDEGSFEVLDYRIMNDESSLIYDETLDVVK